MIRHLTACTALFILLLGAVRALECETSNHACSLGKTKTWRGDLRSSGALQSMLDSVSFNKELIITLYNEDQNHVWTDQLLQLHAELRSLGFSHFLALAHNEAVCNTLREFDDLLSCAWDSSPMHPEGPSGETLMWHNRWKLTARVGRLGYNILSIDADFVFFRDPYASLKVPPFDKIQMLCGRETSHNPLYCNGGFMYVQNVRPDGPVTWVFKEVAMASYRMADDNYTHVAVRSGAPKACLTFDQDLIYDALTSAAVGRRMFLTAAQNCPSQQYLYVARSGHKLHPSQVARNCKHLLATQDRVVSQKAPPPSSWRGLFRPLPEHDTVLHQATLTVPNLNYEMAEELGGRWAGRSAGPYSADWIAMLKSDCPGCSWWDERRDIKGGKDTLPEVLGPDWDVRTATRPVALDEFWDSDQPQEVFGMVPSWLESSVGQYRRGWWTGKALQDTLPPLQVMGHIHAWHLMWHRTHKRMVRKMLGRYDWELGSRVLRQIGGFSVYSHGKPVDKVLALSPDIDLRATRTLKEFHQIVLGLIQMAILSKRVVLMPDIPCGPSWASQQPCRPPFSLSEPTAHVDGAVPEMVVYPVDTRGELVGGWTAPNATQASSQEPLPNDDTSITQRMRLSRKLLSDASAASGAQTSEQGASSPSPWDAFQYRFFIPYLWDPSCLQDEFLGITPPEFFHWLTTPAGSTAQTRATAQNTAFQPADDLPVAQGALANDPPVAQGALANDTAQLSLGDTLLALHVTEAQAELDRFSDVSLLYLGHPVTLQQLHRLPGAQFNELPTDTAQTKAIKKACSENMMLETVIYRSRCRAVYVRPYVRANHDNFAGLGAPRHGTVRDGRLHAAE